MARFICPHGHLKNGRPEVHPSPRYCDIEMRIRSERARARTDPPPHPAAGVPPGAVASPAPPAGPTPPTLPKAPGAVTFGYTPAATLGAGVTGADASVRLEWELTEQQSERFWGAIVGVVGTILNGFLKLMKVKEIPSDVFTMDEGQKFIFRNSLRGLGTTILQKTFRAKTPEDADKIIAGISGIGAFGMMGVKIVVHLMQEVPKSPYWQKIKQRREDARARAQLQADVAAGRLPPEALQQAPPGPERVIYRAGRATG